MLSVGSITASRPSLLLPRDGCNAAALPEWKGISFVTVHHHHPPCRQQPQVCPPHLRSNPHCLPKPPRPPTRGKKKHKTPGFPFQMCRRCQRGQAETKGETRETEPVAPESRRPGVGFARQAGLHRGCCLLLKETGEWEGWGRGGGIRVTSGSPTLNKE